MARTNRLWLAAAGVAILLACTSATAVAAPASFYVVKNAKAHCRVHYSRRNVRIRVRRHGHWVKVKQLRCVYAGSGSTSATLSFPSNLPTAAVTVTVIPTANADQYETVANQEISVDAARGVLANDDGIALAAQLVKGPTHGTLTLARNGSFTYTPTDGWSGVDEFLYRDSDSGGDTSGATAVSIDVAPVATPLSVYQVASDGVLNVSAPGLLAGALGDGLQAELVSGPAGGSLTLNADGSFSYSARSGFSGADSFSFDAVDSSGQHTETVAVSIVVGAAAPNLVPETFAGAVGNTLFQEGGTASGSPEIYRSGSALAGDSDPNGGHLSATPGSIATAQGGTVTMHSDGTFSYQPRTGFRGASDSFAYTVDTSEGASAVASATISFAGSTVWYVNHAAAAGGDGSSGAPFQTLASAGSAASSGDTIFVYGGTYNTPITLGASETLEGQSQGLQIGSDWVVLPAGGNPALDSGVTMTNADTLNGVSVTNGAGAAVTVSNASTFSIPATVTITGGSGDGLDVNNGGAAGAGATVGAAISASAGHSVSIQGFQNGSILFTGAVTDTGTGLDLVGNSSATINFSGLIRASTGANPSFVATNSGTVSAKNTLNTLSSTRTPALDVESTAIGGLGLQFLSISAGSGGASSSPGIVLDNTADTGSGIFLIGGQNSTAGSGGTIANTTGSAAISLTNTGPVSLNAVDLTANSGYGIDASGVRALTVLRSTISGGSMGIYAHGDDASSSVSQQTFDLEWDVITGTAGNALDLAYGGWSNGYLLNDTIGTPGTAGSGSATGDGIVLAASGSGELVAEINQDHIYDLATGEGIDASATSGADLALSLTTTQVAMDGTGSGDGLDMSVDGSTGAHVCLNAASNGITAANTTAANAMTLATAGGIFDIQGLGSGDPATFLAAPNNTLTPSGSGNAVTATGTFASHTCDQP
ncbi:MAG TPA: Ig-like domain-containing protein, partial [Solirubrobacteraceae bacterium]